jgi:zinc/manganese transport system substrate-binding protein
MTPKKKWISLSIAALSLGMILTGCQRSQKPAQSGTKTIVVTYSILGSVVQDLVGNHFTVKSEIPNGLDPHEWEPSAKDIETLNKADLVVENGLGLEGGMEKTLLQARKSGVKFFTASDYIKIRTVGEGEGIPSGDPDQAVGASDPHLWMDPVSIKAVVDALAARIKSSFNVDLSARQKDLDSRLDSLDAEIRAQVATIPTADRKLVTGHESMGYYARRYGFTLVGAIIPSLTTQAEVSAADMAVLKKLIVKNGVKVVFTELGTPEAVVNALAKDAGVKAVTLATHSLPSDGSYFTFQRNLTGAIVDGLK